MSRCPNRVWDAMAQFRGVLTQVQDRGVAVLNTYGSPVYLGQYLNLHQAVDAELARLRSAGRVDPLVVDWGAGVGHCAFVRRSLGDKVVAHALTDPSAAPYTSVLEIVCEIAGIELRSTSDPVKLPFEDGEVDILISCGVLEHVHEGGGSVEQSLGEIARVLRPGGAFVCGHLPRSKSWVEWFNRTIGRSHHDKRFHRREVAMLDHIAGLRAAGPVSRYGVVPRIQFARRLEGSGRDSVGTAKQFERLDRALSRVAAVISQNYLFILRKPTSSSG